MSDIRQFRAQAKHLRCVHPTTANEKSFVEVAKESMERKPYQSRDSRDGERFREVREGDCFRDRRDDFLDQRRDIRESFQGRDGRGRRDYQEQGERDQCQNR